MPLLSARTTPPPNPQRFDREAMLRAGMTPAQADALLQPHARAITRPAARAAVQPKADVWAALAARRFEPFMSRALLAGLSPDQIRALQALPTTGQIDAALKRWEQAQ